MKHALLSLFLCFFTLALRAEEVPLPGDPAALRAQAQTLAAEGKKSPTPWLLSGRAWLAEGREKKALSVLAKALKRDPYCADAYYWRGRAFEALGKADEAANEYQAALKAQAGHADAQAAWKRLKDTAAEKD